MLSTMAFYDFFLLLFDCYLIALRVSDVTYLCIRLHSDKVSPLPYISLENTHFVGGLYVRFRLKKIIIDLKSD